MIRSRVGRLLALVSLAMALAAPTTALAAAGTIAEYPNANPVVWGLTPGPDGNVRFVTPNGAVGRITRSGTVKTWSLPSGVAQFITAGADGNLWFPTLQGKVDRITPQGSITEFPLHYGPALRGIAVGPDGNLWITDSTDSLILRMSPKSGNVTAFGPMTFCTPTCSSPGLMGITPGLDGNLWFVERIANRIGRITTAGVITEFGGLTPYPADCTPPQPSFNAWPGGPTAITTGVDGNLWFTEVCNARIGRITPQGGVTEFALPHPNASTLCQTDSDPNCSHPWSISLGLDGNVWFAEGDGWRLGRITPAGLITEFALPPATPLCCGSTTLPFATGIAPGWDGRMWFGTNAGWIGAASAF